MNNEKTNVASRQLAPFVRTENYEKIYSKVQEKWGEAFLSKFTQAISNYDRFEVQPFLTSEDEKIKLLWENSARTLDEHKEKELTKIKKGGRRSLEKLSTEELESVRYMLEEVVPYNDIRETYYLTYGCPNKNTESEIYDILEQRNGRNLLERLTTDADYCETVAHMSGYPKEEWLTHAMELGIDPDKLDRLLWAEIEIFYRNGELFDKERENFMAFREYYEKNCAETWESYWSYIKMLAHVTERVEEEWTRRVTLS
ncbi:hypothetical protein H8S61_05890 [Eggerthella sp. NSJ-70]|uniref:Uncharacterized protein n=1 Tax=Eggerthella hominis TaxID=2763043 RepID=A0ABR7BQ63_9ACTN|nr:hypothetical protein [Eggerthella hominis]MBC5583722.1 hypothetical protein [Eggerthella hominis]